MSLKERLQEDWKSAMKSKDSFKSSVLSMMRAAVLQVEKTDGSKLDDDGVIAVISKEVKQRRDAILEFEKGNRQDLVDQNNREIEILLEYLPQQLTESEIAEIVKTAVKEVGASTGPLSKACRRRSARTALRRTTATISHLIPGNSSAR